MKKVLAAYIVALGVLVFLSAIGALPHHVGYYFNLYWPLWFVGWGLQGIWSWLRGRRAHSVWPILWLLAGVFFQLRNLHWFGTGSVSPGGVALGVVLIYLGLVVAGGRRWRRRPRASFEVDFGDWRRVGRGERRSRRTERNGGDRRESGADGTQGQASDKGSDGDSEGGFHGVWGGWRSWRGAGMLQDRRMVGEVRYGDRAWHLHPLDIGMWAGEVRLNLATATVPFGETFIDIHLWAGDVRVQVPEDLAVEVEVKLSAGEWSVFGEREQGVGMRGCHRVDPGYAAAAQKVRLRIRAYAGEVSVLRTPGDDAAGAESEGAGAADPSTGR